MVYGLFWSYLSRVHIFLGRTEKNKAKPKVESPGDRDLPEDMHGKIFPSFQVF